jgi:hypothetical protein
LAARSESWSAEVAPVLVRRLRFAVSHFLGFAVSHNRLRQQHPMFPTRSLFEFRLRLEPSSANPSRPRQRPRRLLSWASCPYSTSGFEGPPLAGLAFPLRSALRVWIPSRRLPPFESLPVLFHTGGAHGISPSELSPLARSLGVSTQLHPPTVFLSLLLGESPSRLAEPRFLGFIPHESP